MHRRSKTHTTPLWKLKRTSVWVNASSVIFYVYNIHRGLLDAVGLISISAAVTIYKLHTDIVTSNATRTWVELYPCLKKIHVYFLYQSHVNIRFISNWHNLLVWFLFRPKHNTIFSVLSIEDCPSIIHLIYDLQSFTKVWLCTGVTTLYSRENK